MNHVILHVHARLWRWRVICMPIHFKGSAVRASFPLEQQSCCSISNMQIVTRKCDGVFHFFLVFGSEWKTSGGPRGWLLWKGWKGCQVRGPVGFNCAWSLPPFSCGWRSRDSATGSHPAPSGWAQLISRVGANPRPSIVLCNTANRPAHCESVDPLDFKSGFWYGVNAALSPTMWEFTRLTCCWNTGRPYWVATLRCCDSSKFLTCILNLEWYFWRRGHLGTEEICLLSYNGMPH